VQNEQVKREIYPRHKANCTNAKAKHPRKKFDGCRVYARYTITDPHTGLLLEEFNGALPPPSALARSDPGPIAKSDPPKIAHEPRIGDTPEDWHREPARELGFG
jgi:hypothetical protein